MKTTQSASCTNGVIRFKSGAEAAAVQTLARWSVIPRSREAFGLRRVHRRFRTAARAGFGRDIPSIFRRPCRNPIFHHVILLNLKLHPHE